MGMVRAGLWQPFEAYTEHKIGCGLQLFPFRLFISGVQPPMLLVQHMQIFNKIPKLKTN